MPFTSKAQAKWMFANKPEMAKEWADKTPSIKALPARKKKKAKIVVNNKIKAFGQMDPKTNKVEINVAKHKGDKTELANSIHHELLHVKHPNMSEKDVTNKADRETEQMSPAEKAKLVAKVRNKGINYKKGAMKRKFKMKSYESFKPGAFIEKMNMKKKEFKSNNQSISEKQLAILGLI